MSYTVLESARGRTADKLREQFCLDVLMGLSGAPKSVPSRWFYDARGSRLFERITELPEYYPTRCEFEILSGIGAELAARYLGEEFDIVELGAGDGRKTKVLLGRLMDAGARFSYVPVDISESAVAGLVESLNEQHSDLTVRGVVGDYYDSLGHLEAAPRGRKLVLFLGSNIGNFDTPGALQFLRTIWRGLNEGDMLMIGFDLKKDIGVMERAYNDAQGVTREFNLNLLHRMNRELDADFEPDRFVHHGFYNPLRGAMESHLVSTTDQAVRIGALGRSFAFQAWEPLHLELSCKYLLSDVARLAADTGFEIATHWQDARQWFVDSLWRVRKPT